MATAVNSSTSSNTSLISSLNGSSTTTKTTTADEMQTRFLNLLVTQLKNQDPLNPMDNSQMTTQLSQISTVSGIEKLNATMEKLLGNYSGSQTMQAAAMIGKTVLTAGNALALGNYGAVGGVTLDGAADKVTVSITDSAGKVVQTQQLGAQPAGTMNFSWDGKSDAGVDLPNGDYKFTVKAIRGDAEVKTTALQAGTVNAVTLAKDGLSLQLANNKTVAYSDVQQIMN
ncbi:flagellar biosynthesis protein FlgD [Dechloromonas sp. TW-R-39-2]|uniref:flagellar hook assembly protein FlgD n=1 Tax=Dechloromonas sp. TW-R-39-2 TaxID=2654218 RepID=UPI00193D0438|nr:flagellar hook assembly protein FlgD [Dechloromonas sp. TW-R-39-2]QRM20510.1 flagellar biosynthesis protein FlgD [Dechloromonas sp. TW-R-39-2]